MVETAEIEKLFQAIEINSVMYFYEQQLPPNVAPNLVSYFAALKVCYQFCANPLCKVYKDWH